MDSRIWQNHQRIHASFTPSPAVPFDAAAANRSIEAQLAHVVALRHDAIAVHGLDVTWTYGEFDALTNRIAHSLLAKLGPGAEPVALMGQHRAATVAAMYGIIKAGKFIAAIDPNYPPARVAAILADLSARMVLVDHSTAALAEVCRDAITHAPELIDAEWIDIDAVLSGDAPTSAPEIRNQPDDYAYIIFTSGSTGTPKGVIETHRNVLNFTRQRLQLSCEGTNERTLSTYPYYFSGAASTIFPVLLSGALLSPFDLATQGFGPLKAWIREQEMNWLEGTPAMWRALLETVAPHETFPHVSRSHSGGDRFTGELIQAYFRAFPNAMLRTGYGASEKKYIACCCHDAAVEAFPATLPAGFFVDDLEAVIVDEEGQPVAEGELGEVILYGDYLSPGYWRRPEVTAAAFGRDEKGRFYRTGDLGRLDQDGCLWLYGRRDRQLKIHGQRVETAEIEQALLSISEVEQVMVVPYEAPQGDVELAAYVALSQRSLLGANDLRLSLKNRLASAMVPRYMTILPALPLNSNGKPDRNQLPPPEEPDTARYIAPRTHIQQRLAQMIGDLLNISRVGLEDNFFDLGGTSLLGARLVLMIERTFGVAISPRVLLEAPTVAGLSAAVDANGVREPEASPDQLVVTVAAGTPARAPFFLFLGGGGSLTELMWYANMLRRLDPAQPILAFLAQGIDGFGTPFVAVDEMVTTYVAEIRRRSPHGPYLLGGECVGGKLAFAVAQALRAAGEEVTLLALLDVMPPSPQRPGRATDVLRQWQRRLLYHWDYVRQLAAPDAAHYVWQRVAYWLNLSARQSATIQCHLEARRRYRRLLSDFYVDGALDAPVALLLSQDTARQGVQADWAARLLQPPSVAVVPGDHRSYLADHAAQTASHLDAALAAAQAVTLSTQAPEAARYAQPVSILS